MRNCTTAFSITAATIFLVTAAVAQTATTGQETIRDPEVSLPAQTPPTSQPCVVDAAILQDPRIDRDVLRVMQTSPYFSHSDSRRKIARSVEVSKDKDRTSVEENKYRSLGCGFYTTDTNHKYVSADGGYSNVTAKTSLTGPGGELFFESKETAQSRYGRPNTETTTRWSKTTSLETFGNQTPVAVGDRYGKRETKTTQRGVTVTSYECQVTERRSASQFHPRLSGSALITKCKNEYTDEDHSRTAGSSTSVSFPDSPTVPSFESDKCRLEWRAASEFHPRIPGDAFVVRCKHGMSSWVFLLDQKLALEADKCRLEVRAAAEFHPALQGDAYAARCIGSTMNKVYFPLLNDSFFVDSIDGTFKSDPQERKLLTEIELMQ